MYLTDEYNRGSAGYGEFSAGCNKCDWRGLQDSLAQPHAGVGSAAQPAKAKAFRALIMEAGSISVNEQHGGSQGGQGIHHLSPLTEGHLDSSSSMALLSFLLQKHFGMLFLILFCGRNTGILLPSHSCFLSLLILLFLTLKPLQEDPSFYPHVPLGCCFELLTNQHLFFRGLLTDTAHALPAAGDAASRDGGGASRRSQHTARAGESTVYRLHRMQRGSFPGPTCVRARAPAHASFSGPSKRQSQKWTLKRFPSVPPFSSSSHCAGKHLASPSSPNLCF